MIGRCPGCGALLPAELFVCAACWDRVPPGLLHDLYAETRGTWEYLHEVRRIVKFLKNGANA